MMNLVTRLAYAARYFEQPPAYAKTRMHASLGLLL